MAIHDARLLDAIERLGSEVLNGVTAWRHMFNDNPPELSNTGGARWNPAGLAAIYTSEARETAIAEGQHAIDMQPLRPKARRVIYELRVSARTDGSNVVIFVNELAADAVFERVNSEEIT